MDRKYKLVNINTKEEHLCDKVTIDGFDYYVSDEKCIKGDLCYDKEGLPGHKNNKYIVECLRTDDNSYWNKHCKKIIATNNPNIDIPKVVDVVDVVDDMKKNLYFFKQVMNPYETGGQSYTAYEKGFIEGYNKSKETHPFSDDDMIEFAKFVYEDDGSSVDNNGYPKKQFLQLWKEQKPKVLFYE